MKIKLFDLISYKNQHVRVLKNLHKEWRKLLTLEAANRRLLKKSIARILQLQQRNNARNFHGLIIFHFQRRSSFFQDRFFICRKAIFDPIFEESRFALA